MFQHYALSSYALTFALLNVGSISFATSLRGIDPIRTISVQTTPYVRWIPCGDHPLDIGATEDGHGPCARMTRAKRGVQTVPSPRRVEGRRGSRAAVVLLNDSGRNQSRVWTNPES